MINGQWLACDCGIVHHDPDGALVMTETPAPCCGATGCREIWPGGSWHALDLAFRIDIATDEGERTACVFLASSLEALTEQTVWRLLEKTKAPRVVALALMKRASGRNQLLGVFKDLTGIKPRDALRPSGLDGWFEDWEQLVQARNDLAHGSWHPMGLKTPLIQLIPRIRGRALEAMAGLRNAGLRAIS